MAFIDAFLVRWACSEDEQANILIDDVLSRILGGA